MLIIIHIAMTCPQGPYPILRGGGGKKFCVVSSILPDLIVKIFRIIMELPDAKLLFKTFDR